MAVSDYRSALVTGASSGIGAAAVRAQRQDGLEVHAVARRVNVGRIVITPTEQALGGASLTPARRG